jgi:hypothetical protein
LATTLSLSYSLCPVANGHKEGVKPEAIFARLPYLPLSHSPPSLPPIGDELPPRRTPTTPPASHPSSCTPPSLFSRRCRSCAHPWQPKLRWQDTRCCLAINTLWTPPMPPNRWPPLRPAVDPAAALALTVSSTRVDAESMQCVPERVHVHFSRTLHRYARHRTHTHGTHMPSTPTPRRGLLMTETERTSTKTNLASVDLAHAQVSRLHHWNQSTTPSTEHRHPSQSRPMRTTLRRV